MHCGHTMLCLLHAFRKRKKKSRYELNFTCGALNIEQFFFVGFFLIGTATKEIVP